jgi:hypothetical protein
VPATSEPTNVESQPEVASGWEEPTTVQAPTWDDEPAQPSKPSEPVNVEETPQKEEKVPVPKVETIPAPSAVPAQVQPSTLRPDTLVPHKPATPAAHTRPLSAAHRHKFKADEAVVMPSGNFGTSLDKIGMQFGSLSLGGDDLDAGP